MKWDDFWLPADFSKHGLAIDHVFTIIAWITGVVLAGVQGLLVYAVIRFRRRDGRKAKYIHGHGLTEFVWTALPAAILLGLAFYSNRIWDEYRNSIDLNDPGAAHVTIIAQQFNWNPFYAGRDRKAGQYLVNPTAANPFGKVNDANGRDDIQGPQNLIYLPVDRPTVLEITSKDVIHDFYVPELRINAYAVPGMTVKMAIRPTVTSKSLEHSRIFDVASLEQQIAENPEVLNMVVEIDANAPGNNKEQTKSGWRYFDVDHKTIFYNNKGFTPDPEARQAQIGRLLKAGTTQIRGHLPAYIEVLCAQLCGDQHSRMEGRIVVLDQSEWKKRFEP